MYQVKPGGRCVCLAVNPMSQGGHTRSRSVRKSEVLKLAPWRVEQQYFLFYTAAYIKANMAF